MAKDIDKKRRLRRQKGDSDENQESIHLSDRELEKLDELMKRAEIMIEQLHSLYHQYLAGAIDTAPIERHQQLDQIVGTLFLMAKPTAAYRFRFNNLHASYLIYKNRWDKLMKDLENGILQRRGRGKAPRL